MEIEISNIFPWHDLPFHLPNGIFWWQERFHFNVGPFIFFFHFCVLFEEYLLIPKPLRFSSTLSSRSVSVLSVMSRIRPDCDLVWGRDREAMFPFGCRMDSAASWRGPPFSYPTLHSCVPFLLSHSPPGYGSVYTILCSIVLFVLPTACCHSYCAFIIRIFW